MTSTASSRSPQEHQSSTGDATQLLQKDHHAAFRTTRQDDRGFALIRFLLHTALSFAESGLTELVLLKEDEGERAKLVALKGGERPEQAEVGAKVSLVGEKQELLVTVLSVLRLIICDVFDPVELDFLFEKTADELVFLYRGATALERVKGDDLTKVNFGKIQEEAQDFGQL